MATWDGNSPPADRATHSSTLWMQVLAMLQQNHAEEKLAKLWNYEKDSIINLFQKHRRIHGSMSKEALKKLVIKLGYGLEFEYIVSSRLRQYARPPVLYSQHQARDENLGTKDVTSDSCKVMGSHFQEIGAAAIIRYQGELQGAGQKSPRDQRVFDCFSLPSALESARCEGSGQREVTVSEATDVKDVSEATDVKEAREATDVKDVREGTDVKDVREGTDVKDFSEATDVNSMRRLTEIISLQASRIDEQNCLIERKDREKQVHCEYERELEQKMQEMSVELEKKEKENGKLVVQLEASPATSNAERSDDNDAASDEDASSDEGYRSEPSSPEPTEDVLDEDGDWEIEL